MNKNYGRGYMDDSEISKVSGGFEWNKKSKIGVGVAAGVAALAASLYVGKGVYNIKKHKMDSKDAFKFWTGPFWRGPDKPNNPPNV